MTAGFAKLQHPASAKGDPPAPLVAPTGDTPIDALSSAVETGAEPVQRFSEPQASTFDRITDVVNRAVGSLGTLDQLLNTGMATLPGADLVPGMPAAFIGVEHLGVPHAHLHPPSDGVPLPSIGATIGSGCLSVLIGGAPAARVLDLGLAPTCGGLAPIFEISTGSSNTFIGGARAARMGLDLTRHCNPLGMRGEGHGAEHAAEEAAQKSGLRRALGIAGQAAPAAAGGLSATDQAVDGSEAGAAMTALQTAADAAAMALGNLMGKDPGVEPGMGTLLSGNPTVLIGGFPMPDAQALLMTGWGLRKKATPGKAAPTRTEEGPCRDGHPVDVAKGTAENEFVDFEAHTAPAFRWERYYCSGWSDEDGALGFGFRHCFQHELRLLRKRAVYVDDFNRKYAFGRGVNGRYEGVFAGYELSQRDAQRFLLRHSGFGDLTFERGTDTDNLARLVSQVRDGVESTFHYDDSGLLRRIAQEESGRGRSRRIDFLYDGRGHLIEVRQTDAQAASTRIAAYEYDAAGCLKAFADPLGGTMSYGYDAHRRMIRETDANGYSFFYRYDSQGRCIESTGQDGLWRVVLDYQPGRTVVTRADGGRWTFLYDKARTVTRIVDPYGGTTDRTTGPDGRILEEVDSGGRAMRWLYDWRGANTGRKDRWGNGWPTKDEAPALPNPLAHTVPSTPLALQWGGVENTAPSASVLLPPPVQQLARALFPQPESARVEEHDARGRLVAHADKLGGVERLRLDAAGNIVQRRDKDGRLHSYGIASWNLRESETDPLGNTIRYRYSSKEEITAIVDANGNESAYTYDYKGRMTSVMRHGAVRETYAYDDGDRLLEKRDSEGNLLLRFEVGENGLHSKRMLASGETHTYEYDHRGHFTRASTDRFDVALSYDEHGRRIGDKRDGCGVEHEYREGRLHTTTYFGRFTVQYEAAADGARLIHTPVGGQHRFERGSEGEILLRLGNGTNAFWQFDGHGRCLGRIVWPHARTHDAHSVQFQYSPMGELRRVVDSAAGVTDYHYDAAHRLVGESRDGWSVRRFEYDAGGNLLSAPACSWMRYIEGNRISSAACGAFRYNGRNHLAEQIEERNSRTTYHYNSMDLLVNVSWSDKREVWTAEYDGLCRRIAKAMGPARTEYYWDGDRLAAEVAPNGRLRIYVYVNATSYLPFMFVDYDGCDAAPESGRGYYVFSNQVGLPERIEDTEGTCVWRAMEIDPYGAIEVAPGNEVEYDLRWPGHWFDPETGLHYNRFRSYHPALGRYLQSDPAGQSGGINLYAYTANPLVYVDVLGRECTHGNEHSSECSQCENREEADRIHKERLQLISRRMEIEDEVSGHPGTLLTPGELTGEYSHHAREYKKLLKDIDAKREAEEAALLREQYPSLEDAVLPPFDGKTTIGLMFYTDASGQHQVKKLFSGDQMLSNYDASGHVEGKAALIMRENNIAEAVVMHNHPSGTCNYCDKQVETLLPKNTKLRVIPPGNAKAPTEYWHDQPKDYFGNSNGIKMPRKK